ncbi:unnamed protein product [Amoebophrya sp. A25]|nr:unnamed protein product [Amoebophrya sp. A25]|eukprot:GSA25T00022169001.1
MMARRRRKKGLHPAAAIFLSTSRGIVRAAEASSSHDVRRTRGDDIEAVEIDALAGGRHLRRATTSARRGRGETSGHASSQADSVSVAEQEDPYDEGTTIREEDRRRQAEHRRNVGSSAATSSSSGHSGQGHQVGHSHSGEGHQVGHSHSGEGHQVSHPSSSRQEHTRGHSGYSGQHGRGQAEHSGQDGHSGSGRSSGDTDRRSGKHVLNEEQEPGDYVDAPRTEREYGYPDDHGNVVEVGSSPSSSSTAKLRRHKHQRLSSSHQHGRDEVLHRNSDSDHRQRHDHQMTGHDYSSRHRDRDDYRYSDLELVDDRLDDGEASSMSSSSKSWTWRPEETAFVDQTGERHHRHHSQDASSFHGSSQHQRQRRDNNATEADDGNGTNLSHTLGVAKEVAEQAALPLGVMIVVGGLLFFATSWIMYLFCRSRQEIRDEQKEIAMGESEEAVSQLLGHTLQKNAEQDSSTMTYAENEGDYNLTTEVFKEAASVSDAGD